MVEGFLHSFLEESAKIKQFVRQKQIKMAKMDVERRMYVHAAFNVT